MLLQSCDVEHYDSLVCQFIVMWFPFSAVCLQLSQQIMELQEATTIHSGLQSGGLTRPAFQTEIKTIFKTWK